MCTTNIAEFVCLCHWPLSQLLCAEDVTHHVSKTSTGYPHRPVPVEFRQAVSTREEFDQLLIRWERFERVRHTLSEHSEAAGKWTSHLGETCNYAISQIQAFQASYASMLEQCSEDLEEQINASTKEAVKIMADTGKVASSDLTASIWEYISGNQPLFVPKLRLKGDPGTLLASLRTSVELLTGELEGFAVGKPVENWRKRLEVSEERVKKLEIQLNSVANSYNAQFDQLERKNVLEKNQLAVIYANETANLQAQLARLTGQTQNSLEKYTQG